MMTMERVAVNKQRRRDTTSGWCDERHPAVTTYAMFSGRPRLRCAPAFPRCLLAAKSTEGRCLTGFHGPGRQAE